VFLLITLRFNAFLNERCFSNRHKANTDEQELIPTDRTANRKQQTNTTPFEDEDDDEDEDDKNREPTANP
jgi:hypothetical protein